MIKKIVLSVVVGSWFWMSGGLFVVTSAPVSLSNQPLKPSQQVVADDGEPRWIAPVWRVVADDGEPRWIAPVWRVVADELGDVRLLA